MSLKLLTAKIRKEIIKRQAIQSAPKVGLVVCSNFINARNNIFLVIINDGVGVVAA